MSEPTVYQEPTYGNWRKPRTAGIGKLGLLETIAMMCGLLVLLFVFRLAGPVPGFITFLFMGVALVMLTSKDRHSRSRLDRTVAKRAHSRAARKRWNTYRSGPVGTVPGGTARLPGLLAKSTLHQFTDSFDRDFAVLSMPVPNHVSVVIEVEPTGLALDDPENIDRYVANWGAWLADLGRQPDVVAASVTIETAPDYGVRLRQEVDNMRHPEASEASLRMMEEVKDSFPQESTVTRAWVAVTFTAWRPGSPRPRKITDMGLDLATRLGKFTEHLEQCGAGAAHPVDAQGLCEVVRTAYDPAIAEHIAAAHAQGVTPSLSWSDAGPVAADAGWEWFRHDSGFSKSWVMSVAPRGTVFSNVLEAVLSPSNGVDRKRITMLYRPESAARAMDIAERDVKQARGRAIDGGFRDSAEHASTVQTAQEIAKDAGMVNFGCVMTATVLRVEDAGPAEYEIEDMASVSQLTIRPAFGSQDVAFTAALPLGLVLPDYVAVPAKIREAM